jgi:guanylate kinase
LFVVSAPSGAGKTTLCREVLRTVPNLRFSVSYTTRRARLGEVHGKDYFFVSEPRFRAMIRNREFAEWAQVHGHLYGTHRRFIQSRLSKGTDMLLDVDVQGAAKLRSQFKEGVTIFILPPSLTVLRSRLKGRGMNSPSDMNRRLRNAQREIRQYRHYRYVIVNKEIEKAREALRAIILAERHRQDHWDHGNLRKQLLKRRG